MQYTLTQTHIHINKNQVNLENKEMQSSQGLWSPAPQQVSFAHLRRGPHTCQEAKDGSAGRLGSHPQLTEQPGKLTEASIRLNEG